MSDGLFSNLAILAVCAPLGYVTWLWWRGRRDERARAEAVAAEQAAHPEWLRWADQRHPYDKVPGPHGCFTCGGEYQLEHPVHAFDWPEG